MLDEYVEDLVKRVSLRREAERGKLEDGCEKPDLVRGRSQAFATVLADIQEVLEAHTQTESVPDSLKDTRSTYGRTGGRRAA